MSDRIETSIEKAMKYLLAVQNADGSWTEASEHKGEPPQYRTALATTTPALAALGLSPSQNQVQSYARGANFCFKEELKEEDSLDIWARKLAALRYCNTAQAAKAKDKILNFLLKKQKPDGCWPSFPDTYNLTNYSIVDAIEMYAKSSKALEKAQRWFKRNKAKDGFGWGFNQESVESEVSYTSDVALALLFCGENPLSKELQEARKFIESKQFADGGWPASKTTFADKSTVYGTAMASLALMFLADTADSPQIKKGIKYLLDNQQSDGGWPTFKDGGKSYVYITYYALRVLTFYKFLTEKLESPLVKMLRQKLCNPEIIVVLWTDFERDLEEKFKDVIYKNVVDSNILGSTSDAVARRKDVSKILSERGMLSVAEIIDALKEKEKYFNLNKRSHITLIKNDLDRLRSMRLVYEQNNKYFIMADLLA